MRSFFFSILTLFCLVSEPKAVAETDYNQVGRAVATILANSHFSRQRLDDAFDQRFIDHFLSNLDSNRMFLLQEDVDWIHQELADDLHEIILDGRTLDVAIPIYRRYQERFQERYNWIETRLEQGNFDLNQTDTFFLFDRSDSAWLSSKAEADTLWENRLTDELIREHLRRRASEEKTEETEADNSNQESAPETTEETDKEAPEQLLLRRYRRISEDVQRLSEEDIADLFLSNLSTSFDPHTDYMSWTEQQNFIQSMNASLSGIGALLRSQDDGTVKIEGIVVGGPADKQGELQIDDRIIGVDTLNTGEMVDTLYMRTDRVIELIRGEPDTEVRLKLHPANSPNDVAEIVITRGEVELKDQLASAALYEITDEQGESKRLGWITVPSFYANWDNTGDSSVTKDVEVLLKRLMDEQADGIILDLRNNGGGVLDEAIAMTGLFVERGTVVQVANHFGDSEHLNSFNRRPVYSGPLAVVTNRLSASASEILAGALQDYNRAIIIGDDRTFGKGTVQRVVDVSRQMPLFSDRERAGLVKVTMQIFYRPSGLSTQLLGVESDIVLPSILSAYEIGEASEENPLENSSISAANFRAWKQEDLFLDTLKTASDSRVAESAEFGYVAETIATAKQLQEELEVVLDLETRYQELQEIEQRQKENNAHLRELFAEIEAEDAETMQAWHLTLENVSDEELHPLNEFTENEHMRRKEDEDDLTQTPEYPNGLDPIERETLHILSDLIQLQQQEAAVVQQ